MISNNNNEHHNVQSYDNAIKPNGKVKDHGILDPLIKIIKLEAGHVDWTEIQPV